MTITRGWASDFAKRKFGVEIDKTELVSIMAEAGFPGTVEELEAVIASMKASDVYLALDAEAMIFIHHSLSEVEPEADGSPGKKHLDHMRASRDRRDKVLAKYRPAPAG